MVKKQSSVQHTNYGPVLATAATVFMYLIVQIVIYVVILYFSNVFYGGDQGDVIAWLNSPLSKTVASITTAILLMGGVWFFLRRFHTKPKLIGWVKPQSKDLQFSLKGFAVYIPITLAVLSALVLVVPGLDPSQEQQLGFNRGINGSALVFAFISLVLIPPFVEEILVRGFLFRGLRNGLSFIKAAVFSSALFGVAHLQLGTGETPLWLVAADTFVLGMVAAYLIEKTNSLWPCIGLHFMKNLLAFSIVFLVN